jgi:hypothetical protein
LHNGAGGPLLAPKTSMQLCERTAVNSGPTPQRVAHTDVRPSSLVKLVLMRGSDPQEAAEYCGMLDFPVLRQETDFPRLLQSSPGHQST